MKIFKVSPTFFVNNKSGLNNALKELKLSEKPAIANLKSYYATAEEKLNDILLERIEQKLSTYVVKHNISAFNSLPSAIKKCIKPADIGMDGHISQSYVDSLWDAAKKADKPGVYGIAPSFRGLLKDMPEDSVPPLDTVADMCDHLSDIGDLAEHTDSALEILPEAHEHGMNFIDHIIGLFN